jgi:hypothetical protein
MTCCTILCTTDRPLRQPNQSGDTKNAIFKDIGKEVLPHLDPDDAASRCKSKFDSCVSTTLTYHH